MAETGKPMKDTGIAVPSFAAVLFASVMSFVAGGVCASALAENRSVNANACAFMENSPRIVVMMSSRTPRDCARLQ
jgi:hypothetical protein